METVSIFTARTNRHSLLLLQETNNVAIMAENKQFSFFLIILLLCIGHPVCLLSVVDCIFGGLISQAPRCFLSVPI